MPIKNLKIRGEIVRHLLPIFLLIILVHSPTWADDLTAVTRSAKSFSRLQSLINLHRSIEVKQSQNQLTGGLPLPKEVVDEASQISSDTETWGCDMKVTEKPAVEIKFGDQTTKVVPFTITYEGQVCPIHLVADMDIANVQGKSASFKIKTKIDFKVDPSKKAQFGFETALLTQDATVDLIFEQQTKTMKIGLTSTMDSDGGPDGKIHGEQGLDFVFNFTPPLNLNATSEDFDRFTIDGKTTNLRRKQTLNGLTAATAEYYVNEVKSDQKTFETALQGLQFFGLNEEPAKGNTKLLCSTSFVDSKLVSSSEEAEFKQTGKFPAAQAAFSWASCGVNATKKFGDYEIADEYAPNWLLRTIKKPQMPDLTVYFLFDEDSMFIRKQDTYSIFMFCKAVPKCN